MKGAYSCLGLVKAFLKQLLLHKGMARINFSSGSQFILNEYSVGDANPPVKQLLVR